MRLMWPACGHTAGGLLGWWAAGLVGCEPEAPVPGLPCWCGLTVAARAWPRQPCPMVTCVQVLLPRRGSEATAVAHAPQLGPRLPSPAPHPTWADLGSPRGLPGRASPPEPWRSSHSMSVFLCKARSSPARCCPQIVLASQLPTQGSLIPERWHATLCVSSRRAHLPSCRWAGEHLCACRLACAPAPCVLREGRTPAPGSSAPSAA